MAAVTAAVTAAVMCGAVPIDTGAMRNFGHSIKNGHLVANTEINLFEHNCTAPPCTITQMHCPTAGPGGWYEAKVRLYIDGDAPLEMTLLDLANIGDPQHIGPPPPPPAPPSRPNYTEYYLGTAGQTCSEVCAGRQLHCDPHINVGFGVDKGAAMRQHLAQYNASIVNCTQDGKKWWAPDQPGFVCGNDPNGNTNDCIGWDGVPATVSCDGKYPEQCRVCHCTAAAPAETAPRVDPGGSDKGPWGESLWGHTANNGGVYSTVRVPFGKSLRATLTSPNSGTFWFIIRGVEALPVVIGDLTLPATARLRLRNFSAHTDPNQLVTLADVPSGTSGAVLNVRFDASAGNYGYLEACMRVYPDGAQAPIFFSSGAEDYFLSAYYFNEGMFKTPNSGLTFFDGKGTLSAYKTHDRDPLIFDDGLRLVFRNGETTTGCGDTDHCPNQYCAPGQAAADGAAAVPLLAPRRPAVAADYHTLVWLYEWPRQAPAAGGGAEAAAARRAALRLVARLGAAELLSEGDEAALQRRLLSGDAGATELAAAYAEEAGAQQQPALRRAAAALRAALL